MTVIATDGRTIAIDRAMTYGHQRTVGCKYMRMKDGQILLFAGSESSAHLIFRLYDADELFENFPASQLNGDNGTSQIIRVDPVGRRVFALYNMPVWIPVKGKMTWGSGSELALGAMLAGASPTKAVKLAGKHSAGCGLGVDTFQIR